MPSCPKGQRKDVRHGRSCDLRHYVTYGLYCRKTDESPSPVDRNDNFRCHTSGHVHVRLATSSRRSDRRTSSERGGSSPRDNLWTCLEFGSSAQIVVQILSVAGLAAETSPASWPRQACRSLRIIEGMQAHHTSDEIRATTSMLETLFVRAGEPVLLLLV